MIVHEDVQEALQALMWMDAHREQIVDQRLIDEQVSRLRAAFEAHLSKPPTQTWPEFWSHLPGREMHQVIRLKEPLENSS